jgi:hypothetical protein
MGEGECDFPSAFLRFRGALAFLFSLGGVRRSNFESSEGRETSREERGRIWVWPWALSFRFGRVDGVEGASGPAWGGCRGAEGFSARVI